LNLSIFSTKLIQCFAGPFVSISESHFHEMHRAQLCPGTAEDELLSPPSPFCQVIAPPSSVYDTVLPASIRWTADSGEPMPLIDYLKDNFDRGTAWHRNDERLARGLPLVSSPAVQLEGWERELVWTETLLLTGTAEASFRHLARGWGRDKGFHRVLAQSICDRHGSVERKPAAVTVNAHPSTTTKKKKMTAIAADAAVTMIGAATVSPSVGFAHYCTPIVAESVSSSSSSSSSSDTSAATAGENVWDAGACYYELEYNERLASELLLEFVEEEPYGSDDSVVPFANHQEEPASD
jgi:hypothetical protein